MTCSYFYLSILNYIIPPDDVLATELSQYTHKNTLTQHSLRTKTRSTWETSIFPSVKSHQHFSLTSQYISLFQFCPALHPSALRLVAHNRKKTFKEINRPSVSLHFTITSGDKTTETIFSSSEVWKWMMLEDMADLKAGAYKMLQTTGSVNYIQHFTWENYGNGYLNSKHSNTLRHSWGIKVWGWSQVIKVRFF